MHDGDPRNPANPAAARVADPGVDPFADDAAKRGGYQYTTDAPLSSRLANERLTEVSLELADISGKRVIDIGCGDGAYTVELLERGRPAEILGVDPAPEAIRVATERAGGQRGISFATGSAYELEFPDGAFDLALLRGVLHHVERPSDAIGEALRVAPVLMAIEPNGYNPGLKVLEKVSSYHREHGERSYAPRSLDRWVAEHGGRVAQRRYVGFVPMFCPDWYARAAKRIEPALEATPGIRSVCCAQYNFRAERPA